MNTLRVGSLEQAARSDCQRTRQRWFSLVALVLFIASANAQTSPPTTLDFSAEERGRILSFGPWPPPATLDPSNRVSGNADAITLGRRLFFDPRMSKSGYIGCVSCHQPDRAWTDHKARAHGIADVPRNTPALANLRLQRWYGWAGSADSLWMQSILPILDAREIESSPALVKRVFQRDPELACLYQRVFHTVPSGADEVVLANVGKALAAFQETLITGRTAFDEFRDALARGDAEVAAKYPSTAARGLRLFVGRGNCVGCHSGPNFSNGEFRDNGVLLLKVQDTVDAGRHESVRTLQASPFTLLSRHNDDVRKGGALATRRAVRETGGRGEFRTPSLRNVAVTAPYMHDGRFDALHDVLQHYSELDPEASGAGRDSGLRPLRLTAAEADDLIAFLNTLTDVEGERRTVPPRGKTPCDE